MSHVTYHAHETGRMQVLHGSPLASFQRRAAPFFDTCIRSTTPGSHVFPNTVPRDLRLV